MGVLISVNLLLAVPYSRILITPQCIDRITCLIAIHILGTCARVHIGRNHLISGSRISNLLIIMGHCYGCSPLEVLLLYILCRYAQLDTHITCITHIGKIGIVAGHLRITHIQEQVLSSRIIRIKFDIHP